jgi:tetratricopeptide (TPR) repeat protein
MKHKMQKFIYLFSTLLVAVLLAIMNSGCSAKAKKAYYTQKADQDFEAGQYDKAEIEYAHVRQIDQADLHALDRLGDIYFDEGRFSRAAAFLMRANQLATNNADVHLKLGLIYLSVGKLKEARDEAGFVLDKNPQDNEAPLLLAEASVEPRDIQETRQRLQKLSQKGDRASLEVALGTLSFREQDLKTAEAALNRAAKLDPKSDAAYSALGNLYWSEKDLTNAEAAFKTASDLSPSRSTRRLQYAQFKIQNGDVAAGQRILQEIVQKAPDYLPAWLKLADIAAAEKKYDDSAAILSKILARDPENYDALLLNGGLSLAEGDTAKAVTQMEQLQKIYPQAPTIYYQLALAYLANNETEKAVDSLNRAINLQPSFPEATLLLAQLEIQNNNFGPAIISLKQLIQQQPKLAQAQLALANAYRAQGNFDAAFNIYQELQITFPQNPQIPLLIGAMFLEQKKMAEAREAFNKALELAPDFMSAIEQLVDLDVTEKQFPAALQVVQTGIGKNPKQPAFQILSAKIYMAQNDAPHAEAALLKAVELQPDSPGTYLMLAQLYMNTHQDQKALAELKIVTGKNPKDTGSLMLAGMIYDSETNYDAAKDSYEKLLEIDPKYTPALNNLAYLYSEHLGQLDRAYDLARQARILAPADPATADTLGWILYQKGQYPEALSLLQESADKLSAEPEVQFHAGMAHYMMGDEEPARIALQRALQLSGKFNGHDECGECLAILAIDPKTAGAGTQTILEKRTAAQPDDQIALARLADIYDRQNAPDKAAEIWEDVLKVNPNNVDALTSLARLYAPQDAPKAFELAKTAYKLAPDDPNVVFVLGRLAYQTGNYKWSSSLLQMAAQNQPNNPEALYDFAEAAYSEGNVSDARAEMQNALQTGAAFAKAADARQFLDMTALAADPRQAMAASDRVEEILKSNPNYVPALVALAYINEQKANFSAAQQGYEEVLGQYADFSPAQRQLAILYAQDPNSDTQKAYQVAMQARLAFPDDSQVAKALGIIVYRQGDFARAENLLEEAADKRGNDAALMYYLGMSQYRLKDQAGSRTSLQRALALKLSGNLAEEAKRTLNELK